MDYQSSLQIPLSSPDISDAERQAVLQVLNTPNLSMGAQIEAFEQAFRKFTGSQSALGVNSGTAGLHMCVRAAGILPGDYVLTTPFSFVASSNVVLYEQAIPLFVDVDERTGNINPTLLQTAAADLMQGGAAARRWLPRQGGQGSGTLKAILAVDVFGQPADMDLIRKTTDQFGLKLIEDSCEALGAEYKGRKAGTLGDFGVFAFYPNKQITTGEGGLVITNDDAAAHFMQALRNQGRAPGDTWLQHTHLGYNYRLDEMSAALGAVQMSRIEELLQKRERVASWYTQRLVEIGGVEVPFIVPETTRMSWFVYVIRLAREIDRNVVAQKLSAHGIPTRPYFSPIHLQPYMIEKFGYRSGDFPITEDLGKRSLAIPFSGKMSEEQVEMVCRAVQDCI